MQTLIQLRWVLLGAALLCGLATALPWVYPASAYWDVSLDWALPAAALLQGAGSLAMSMRFAGAARLWAICGYVSAIAWVIAFLAGLAAVAAGAGGLVYGLLIMLPATVVGLLTQIAALIGFAGKERGARA